MPDLGNLNVVDYAVIAILVVSGYMATQRGLTREILGLVGWVGAIIAGQFFSPYLLDRFGEALGEGRLAAIVGFSVPFAAVLIVWRILSTGFTPGLKTLTFGWLDQFLGFVFGIARGVVLVTLAYMAGVLMLDSENEFPESVQASESIAPTRAVAGFLAEFAPKELRKNVEDGIPEIVVPGAGDGGVEGSLLPDELPAGPARSGG